jgi:hypothetical protein
MTTSPSTGLSPEAKEFVPLIQIPPPTIPLYIDEHPIRSIYPPEQLIYPLIKFPEVEFHIQPSQQFHIDSCSNNQSQSATNNNNTSQIVLLPTNGCYPGTQILYSSNNQSSQFYPEQSRINYSHQQPKSNRISTFRPQRGTYHSVNQRNSHYNQQESTTLNNHRNFHKRGNHSRQNNEQKKENLNYHINENESRFQFRAEDFPGLPINPQQSDKIPSQILNSENSTLSWNTIVSNPPRPRSVSPSSNPQSNRNHSSNKQTSSPSQSKSKPTSSIEQQRSQSLTNSEAPKNEQDDEFVQTKEQKKRSKRQRHKNKQEPSPPQQESVPFVLDENAFPTLGEQISIPLTNASEKDAATKNNGKNIREKIKSVFFSFSSFYSRINKKIENKSQSILSNMFNGYVQCIKYIYSSQTTKFS